MNRRPDSNTGGFALISVIFALLIISVMATGGLYTAHQESLVAQAERNADDALYMAENGVAEVLAEWNPMVMDSLAPWEADTLTGAVSGEGEWSVEVLRVTDRIFYLQGEGQVMRNGELASTVSRTVGLATARPNLQLSPQAALTTRGPTTLKGNAEVHGEDETPPGWGGWCPAPGPDKAGITSDDASEVGTKGQAEITGSPAVLEDGSIADSTFTQFGEMSWDDLTDLATITVGPGNINNTGPDSTAAGVCDTDSDTNWGNPENPDGACGNYFPIIHATGSHLQVQSGGVGQGILLVEGDLDLRGSFLFHGLIIVQGSFETQGSGNRVRGAVMSGNTYLEDQSLVGGSVVGYSSCALTRSVENNEAFRSPRMFADRSWSDLSRAGM